MVSGNCFLQWVSQDDPFQWMIPKVDLYANHLFKKNGLFGRDCDLLKSEGMQPAVGRLV
jgi:hypothetical protein